MKKRSLMFICFCLFFLVNANGMEIKFEKNISYDEYKQSFSGIKENNYSEIESVDIYLLEGFRTRSLKGLIGVPKYKNDTYISRFDMLNSFFDCWTDEYNLYVDFINKKNWTGSSFLENLYSDDSEDIYNPKKEAKDYENSCYEKLYNFCLKNNIKVLMLVPQIISWDRDLPTVYDVTEQGFITYYLSFYRLK